MKTILEKIFTGSTMIVFLCFLTVMSCSDDTDFGEQYKKTIYIVNSNSLLYTGEHYFEKENDEIVISVYCASSEPIGSDLKVRLKVHRDALDSLNTISELADPSYISKLMLPKANYQMEGELYTTIKAGRQYGTLNIPFDFTGLDPDYDYALPISLVSNSADYDINPDVKSIVYEIKMINEYSGSFAGSSSEETTSRISSVQPALKAMSVNTVRMPIHNLDDDIQLLDTNFMLLTIAEDGSVTISPWANALVTDLGESTYDFVRQRYELNYEYNGIPISEIITNIDAPQTE
ncbi:MAG: DUF1735 domain-containing protein [Bacteroidales bacterium]|jgi:hypothetical protein|nr:DUF1735 domain-containing protein [Bacteroidales bacterium]